MIIEIALHNYKVNDYSKLLYDFIWRDFCDWYVEIIKIQTNYSNDNNYKELILKNAINIYEKILILLHPIMPYLTEEIWHLLDEKRNDNDSISLQNSPIADSNQINFIIENDFEFIKSIIEEIRKLRSEINIPPQQKSKVKIIPNNSENNRILSSSKLIIESLAFCSELEINQNLIKPEKCLNSVFRETEILLLFDDSIDIEKEKQRLQKEIERLERNIIGSESKLSNEKFISNAPENIVQFEKEKIESMKESLLKVKVNFQNL